MADQPAEFNPILAQRLAVMTVGRLVRELEELAPYLPTLPEMTDADEALRSLRHLYKQLEGSST